MSAWAALTSDDLPMPRAPQSSALLAGRPLAKRSVFSIKMSRRRSMPLSRPSSTRLTRGTGASRPLGCHMKASALASTSALETFGTLAESPAAIASSARMILSALSSLEAAGGRFVAASPALPRPGFAASRGPDLRGFFDIWWIPDQAPISGLRKPCKPHKSMAWRRCNWAAGRYSPREICYFRQAPFTSRIVRMLITPAFAQAAGAGDTNSMLMSLLPFALIFVIMYFLILRPQQKKVKDHAELVKNIRRGDTVVTSGGLVGKVTKVVDDDQIEFEISDGVRVRQMRQMISGVRAKGEPAKEKAETAKDETSAS